MAYKPVQLAINRERVCKEKGTVITELASSAVCEVKRAQVWSDAGKSNSLKKSDV